MTEEESCYCWTGTVWCIGGCSTGQLEGSVLDDEQVTGEAAQGTPPAWLSFAPGLCGYLASVGSSHNPDGCAATGTWLSAEVRRSYVAK